MNLASIDWTVIGTGIAIIAFVYAVYRNLKSDIHTDINGLSKRIDIIELRLNSLEERMFLLSTGKTLSQAILEERMKKEKAE